MEAARSWARRAAMFSIPRSVYHSHPISAARLITAPNCWFSFATASYQPAPQAGAAAETTNQPGTGTGHRRASKRDSLTHDVPAGSGATSYAADTAKKGVKKATEVADTAKETVDGAWKVAKQAAEGVKETVTTDDGGGRTRIEEDVTVNEMKNVEQPVDTYEYRSIEELREKAGGYDLADDNKT